MNKKRAQNIHRVLFWTGPALKVLNMGLVPPNKKNDCFLLCIYAMHVCMWDTQVSVEYSCGSGRGWKGLPSWGSHGLPSDQDRTIIHSELVSPPRHDADGDADDDDEWWDRPTTHSESSLLSPWPRAPFRRSTSPSFTIKILDRGGGGWN